MKPHGALSHGTDTPSRARLPALPLPPPPEQVVQFCKEKDVGLVVVGPEVPLVAGLADDLQVGVGVGVCVGGRGDEQ